MHIDGRAGNLRRCADISEPDLKRFTLLILFRRRTGDLSKLRPDVWRSRQALWILKKYWKPFGFLRERLFVCFSPPLHPAHDWPPVRHIRNNCRGGAVEFDIYHI